MNAIAVQDPARDAPLIIGRDAELQLMRRLVGRAEAGEGGALLVRGSAGVGKSALLRTVHAEAAGRGLTVLSASGVETERWFPYAALHLLLRPLDRNVERLPPGHRRAIRQAFGAEQTQPEVHQVALATLELLADGAHRRPILLLIDDLQWVDTPSRDVLTFVARRTDDHAILLVGAARSDHVDPFRWDDQADLDLGPLDEAAAAALLDAAAPELPPQARALLLTQAKGNPLALVELPKSVQGTPEETEHLPLTRRLEVAFAIRTDSMSAACRMLLLILAAEPTAPLSRLLAAASQLTGSAVTLDTLQESTDAGLVALIDGHPEFRHPLMRSAIYRRATITDRLAAHRCLASVLADDPERQLIHLAEAAIGPDEELAARLERFADAAQAQGKIAAGVPALRLAARLVRDPHRQTRILIRAAELSSQLSDRADTRALLAQADLNTLGPVERGRLMLVSDNAAFEPDEPQRRIHDMVLVASAAMDVGDRHVAEDLLWRAAARCFFQDGDAATRAETAAELQRWNPDPDGPHSLAVRLYTEPYRYGADVLPRLHRADLDRKDGYLLHFLGSGAMVVGDFTHASRFLARTAAIWREQGRLGLLVRALAGSWPRFYLGRLEQARTESEEGRLLAREAGESIAWLGLTATAALVAVTRGEIASATRMIEDLRASSLFLGMPFAAAIAQQVNGLLALFDGRAGEAYDVFARIFDPDDPHHHSVSCWLVVPDLADAAVAAGTVDQARGLLADLADRAARLPSEMMRMAEAYRDAVLAPDHDAERLYRRSLTALPEGCLLIRARLHLHHGRWLRQQRRYLDARAPLRTARDEFDRLGARSWAEAARSQLRAVGENTGRRYVNIGERLSSQEMQIALLASQGLSNREIGERLFISHRTVSSHLYRIYPRLGVTNRGQLAAVLTGNDQVGD
ncbi:ATP-binding protein [Micromonospora humi]|uniref:Regulatory protein, luxR family n=1 Tax=Micromonospora humi TaxID=745366 RepID=A0A1C5K3N5_9ACTN|nr:LuxR family transcriptional regulator [Micromonospora humi]SCG77407.1 regulatory protein, luxR family [Micromonospora humi]